MFSPRSRYAAAGEYSFEARDGSRVVATRLPIRARPAIRGFHRRTEGQRPDQIAAHYLSDATAFWRLCDAGDALAPDTLAGRDLIAIPKKER